MFIKEGEVVASLDLRSPAQQELRVVAHARNVSGAALTGLRAWTASAHLEAERLTFTVRSKDVLPDIVRHLVACGTDLLEVTPERVPLEEMFVKIMGEDRGL